MADAQGRSGGFAGARVLSLESRRAEEMATLIRNQGGVPIVAPSMREVPLSDNHAALELASELIAGRVHALILLTGTGTRILLRAVEEANQSAAFLAALKSVPVIARGPKPVAALAEAGVRPTVTAPEPNTWREVLDAIDAAKIQLKDRTVAVQEYGAPNQQLLDALAAQGARILRVPVYDWRLPDDLGPLRLAVRELANGQIDVVLFTTSVQARHLMELAEQMQLTEAIRASASRMMVASIGPVTSEEIRLYGLPVDLEPSHPRMGFLVREAAEQSAGILARKRSAAQGF